MEDKVSVKDHIYEFSIEKKILAGLKPSMRLFKLGKMSRQYLKSRKFSKILIEVF